MEKKGTHWLYGIITGIVVTGIFIALSVSGLDNVHFANHLTDLPFLVGLILNAVAFSKANNANVTYADVFKSCFKVTCIVSVCAMIWYAIFVHSHPEMIKEGIATAKAELEKKHTMTQAQIDKGMEQSEKTLAYTVTFSMALVQLIFGTIYSMVAAAVAKKRPRPVFES